MKTFSLFSFLSFFVLFIACQKENGIDAQTNLPKPDSTFTIVEDFSDTSGWIFESSKNNETNPLLHYIGSNGISFLSHDKENEVKFLKLYDNHIKNLNPKKIIFKATLSLNNPERTSIIRLIIGNKYYDLDLQMTAQYFVELTASGDGKTTIKSYSHNQYPIILLKEFEFNKIIQLHQDTSAVSYILNENQFTRESDSISIEILLNHRDISKKGVSYGHITAFNLEHFELTVIH